MCKRFYFDPTQPAYAARQLTYYERGNSAVDYSWTSGDFNSFDVLRQIKAMDELAAQSGAENYRACQIFRAVLFNQLTDQFGDIPYSNALGALNGNTNLLMTNRKMIRQSIYLQ